jgi:glutaminyl-peptide cyclotransferase
MNRLFNPLSSAVALVVAAVVGIAAGCGAARQERESGSSPDSVAPAGVSPAAKAAGGEPRASEVRARLVADRRVANPLDADRAMGYLSKIANIGPRYTASPGMREQREFLVEYFTQAGAKVTEQPFKIRSLQGRGNVDGSNMIVEWHPERKDRVLVCAHYDTRPLPDYDPDPRKRRTGIFIGANDGASGVALLMELTHHLKTFDPQVGVDFVLFDAEDYVYDDPRGQLGEYCLGSQHFAREYRRSGSKNVKYHWGVLVDMVGDAQLEIRQEQNSVNWRDTRPLVQELWKIAAELRVEEFVPRLTKSPITDDHVMLRDIGKIPTCNLIDAMYPDVSFGEPGCYWHTEQDIPANCSGESVAKVGWVVLEWLKRVKVE